LCRLPQDGRIKNAGIAIRKSRAIKSQCGSIDIVSLKLTGKLIYAGPDDPPCDYYYFRLSDGRTVYIGFKSDEFAGNYHHGIPELPGLEHAEEGYCLSITKIDKE
jgi:hypothetical protein